MKKDVKHIKTAQRGFRHPLFTSITLVLVLGGLIVFLLNYMLNYIPRPTDFVTDMQFNAYSNLFYTYEVVRYPTDVEVTANEPDQDRLGVGVVVDSWNLKFGSIPVGGSSTRFMELANLGQEDAKVILRAYGNVSRYVGFSRNNFILYPKDNVTIRIIFHPDPDADTTGNYTGEIDRIIKIPKYGFLYHIW
jgi:hypothetical protein